MAHLNDDDLRETVYGLLEMQRKHPGRRSNLAALSHFRTVAIRRGLWVLVGMIDANDLRELETGNAKSAP